MIHGHITLRVALPPGSQRSSARANAESLLRQDELHRKLVATQETDELRRKQQRARRKDIWTQEDMDLAEREAEELYAKLRFN